MFLKLDIEVESSPLCSFALFIYPGELLLDDCVCDGPSASILSGQDHTLN